jgi:hypothetical protein
MYANHASSNSIKINEIDEFGGMLQELCVRPIILQWYGALF